MSKTDEELENQLAFAQYAGQAIGFEGAASIVLQAAKNYFAMEKDEVAGILRRLGKQLDEEAKRSRDQQRKYGELL